ncbi:sensor domain-containing diguanylate cyclase [Proteocatella sphenisci]|uniref:sensor domain-containing diguanylate cyclase n=1 Tax=Proteocatella sphenisci TaxID=181070 RepID=UPI0004AFBCF7|nr:sensor domain-containing diguanylate cyclase [Proteocatella sphenisci]
MNGNIYKEAMKNASCAFAYHEAVFDKNNKMTDYIFIDVNEAFEEFTGMKKQDVINKRLVRDIYDNKKDAQKWVEIYGQVIAKNEIIEFEEYSLVSRRNYHIKAYRVGKTHFVTLFTDKTFEKKMSELSKYFRTNRSNDIDYEEITKFACDLSGAEYAALNLFKENDNSLKTVSIYGLNSNIKKELDKLGIDLIGKNWDYDPQRDKKLKGSDITCFDKISDFSGDVIANETMQNLEKNFNLGNSVLAKIRSEEKIVGDFVLVFKKESKLKNRDLFLLYLSQIGQFLEQTRLEKSLKASQRRFYTLAEYAPIGFISCDLSGEVTYANRKLLEIMDSPSYEATKKVNLLEFSKLREIGFSQNLAECMEKDRLISFEMPYKSTWGKQIWVSVHFTPSKENDLITGANIIVDDITDKKKNENELKEKASRDSLTRAYNRYALDSVMLERLNESKDRHLTSCISVLDVDNFKYINDTYGHKAGDDVLKYLAARIKKELREEDLIIRTGGDEFVIYLHDIKNEKNAAHFIDRIYSKITGNYRIEDNASENFLSFDVGCSIGASFFPRDGETVKTLMAKADEALYKVKKNGKSGYQILK